MEEQVVTYHHSENAEQYRKNANFVYNDANTAPVLSLLQAQPGDAILDLGCGSGELTTKIASLAAPNGGVVVGVDASQQMVHAARRISSDASQLVATLGGQSRPALSYEIADGCNLLSWVRGNGLVAAFDKCFSSAALHWMKASPKDVIAGVHAALKPGGIFAAEMGGFMNCVGVRSGLHRVLKARGYDPAAVDPWYFPTAEAYTQLLTSTTLDPPFQIECCDLVPRPTPLPNGLSSWLETFGGSFLNVLPTAKDRADAVAELEELLRPDLFDPQTGTWTAMYVRLRFKAVKPVSPGSTGGEGRMQNDLVCSKKLQPDEASWLAAQKLESDFVDRTVLIHLPAPQTRVFKGTFRCVDDGGNVVLMQTEEWTIEAHSGHDHTSTEDRVTSRRFVGTVMIKGSDVARIEVQAGFGPPLSSSDVFSDSTVPPSRGGWPADPDAYA